MGDNDDDKGNGDDQPRIESMEFLNKVMVGFPIFPIRIKATENFDLKASEFSWELVKEKGKDPKTSKLDNPSTFVYFPTANASGSLLRFTCTPSDGTQQGEPFSVETKIPVSLPPVKEESLICRQRISRLAEKKDPKLIRVVTYNTLADEYTSPNLFKDSPKESLLIDFRLPLLNKEIMDYDGDIVCLQEVDTTYYKVYYEPFLSMNCNYEGAFCSKFLTKGPVDGLATFFNRSKFDYVYPPSQEGVNLLNHMKTLGFWEETLSKNSALINRLEARNTILQINTLRSKDDDNLIIVVANTHLYSRPGADHIRLIQTITCVDYIQSHIQKIENENSNAKVSLFFCGDFNCRPPFSVVRFLNSGEIKSSDMDWTSNEKERLSEGVAFKHTLNLANSHEEDILTNITIPFEGCLDYIFYQPGKMEMLRNYPPPSKAEIALLIDKTESKVALPNNNTPSDHLPLIVDFVPSP